ncbi:hypothetical protein BP5796_12219 [Coleophoma crateriformis]|uniref:Major facilitator superfamily (MFS) profile domain-containing protein n=1 Tax=Coleophoma crateriformis TaxID=565419 RepID=A0A3D8Q912_9HELO|nr:hypothetical protein BP5796_12219 [Coleophoma crateriformis]
MEQEGFHARERFPTYQYKAVECHNPTTIDVDEALTIRRVFWCIFGLKFLVQINTTSLELPLLRLVEHTVCKAYLGTNLDEIDEDICKVPAVQDKVARIMGYKSTFDSLPCLLTAMIYGSLSSRHGRKLVVMLSLTGQFMSWMWIVLLGFFANKLPVELIWLSSLLLFIGGGRSVEMSILYTSLCDAAAWNRRTSLLLFLHGCDGIAGLIGYPLGSVLMQYRLWAPFGLAGIAFALQCVFLWFMPETSPYIAARIAPPNPALTPEQDLDSEENELLHPGRIPSNKVKGLSCDQLTFETRTSDIRVFCEHPGLRIIFLMFFFKRIAFASERFAFQYASERLHKKIFQTFWMGAFVNAGTLLSNSVLLPLLTRTLNSPVKDVWVIHGSLIDLVAGVAILWRGCSLLLLGIGLFICGLGEGLEVGLQSLGSYIVGEAKLATFFSFVSILSVAGELLGGPIMAISYAVRDKDKQPLGLCYLLSAVLFGCLLIIAYRIKTSQQ